MPMFRTRTAISKLNENYVFNIQCDYYSVHNNKQYEVVYFIVLVNRYNWYKVLVTFAPGSAFSSEFTDLTIL